MSDFNVANLIAAQNADTPATLTTSSQIDNQAKQATPWWETALIGVGLLAGFAVAGGAARNIDLSLGRSWLRRSGMDYSEAMAKYGAVTSEDITSTAFGRLPFTSSLIGQPKTFLSDMMLFNKHPDLRRSLFNTSSVPSTVNNIIASIPPLQKARENIASTVVKGIGKVSSFYKATQGYLRGGFGAFADIDTHSAYEAMDTLSASGKAHAQANYKHDNYFVERFVHNMTDLASLKEGAPSDLQDEIKANAQQIFTSFQDTAQRTKERGAFMGMQSVSYGEHASRFNLDTKQLQTEYESARNKLGVSTLPEWQDIAKMPASPDLFKTAEGDLAHAYSASKMAIDATKRFIQTFRSMPYIGFNPMTLLQPGFTQEVTEGSPVIKLTESNFVPYKNGMTTVKEIAKAKGLLKDESQVAEMYIVNGHSYIHSGNQTMALKEFGDVHALRSGAVSSSINRIYAYETGMYRFGNKGADVPFNNKNNVGNSLFKDISQTFDAFANKTGKKWEKTLQNKETSIFDVLATVGKMHSLSSHDVAWRTTAETLHIPEADTDTLAKTFKEYVVSSKNASSSVAHMLRTDYGLSNEASQGVARLFDASTKEKQLYNLMKAKGSEALTDRFMKSMATNELSQHDVMAVGVLKYKMQSGKIPSADLIKAFHKSTNMFTKQQSLRDVVNLHLLTTYTTEQAKSNKAGVTDWLAGFIEGKNAGKVSKEYEPFDALIQQHGKLAKRISSTHKGVNYLTRLFRSNTEEVENVSKIKPTDYLIIGKNRRNQWGNVGKTLSFKDRLLQGFPTPGTYAHRSTMGGFLSHWLVERPYDLLELTGLGRPHANVAYNAASTLGALLLRKIAPLVAGVAALGYGNYLVNKTTGVNVKEQSVKALNRVAIGGLQVGQYTGIVPAIQLIHQHYPGAIAAGTGLATRYFTNGRSGMLMASMASFAESVPTARQAALALTGVNQVPVKAGRWWELGDQPFQGGRVEYYRPSLPYLATTGWQYSSTLWSSQKNYWKYGSMLPTPTNMFDILPIFKKTSFLGNLHRYDRPYGTADQSGTVQQQFTNPALNVAKAATGFSSVAHGFSALASYSKEQQMQSSQLESLRQQAVQMRSSDFSKTLNNMGQYASEYLGMPGFVAAGAYNAITGHTNSQPVFKANASFIAGGHRRYYEQELGSGFGLSELLRRLTPNTQPWYSAYTGNIPNTQPSWVPMRFQVGDPYAQLEMGEVRMPGQAYLMTHPLANGQYSSAEQLAITGNISPRSSAYTTIQQQLQANPPKSAAERYTMFQAEKQHEQILMGNAKPFSPYQTKLTAKKVQLGKYLGNGAFASPTNPNMFITFAGMQTSVDAIAAHLFQTKDITLTTAYQKAQQLHQKVDKQFSTLANSTVTATVPADSGLRYQMQMSGLINEEIYNKDVFKKMKQASGMPEQDTTMSYYANTKAPFAGKFDTFAHYHMPKFIGKFTWQTNAEEYYKRFLYSGTMFQNWNTPIKSFILPGLLTPTGGRFSSTATATFLGSMSGAGNPLAALPNSLALGLLRGAETFIPSTPTPENAKRLKIENQYMLAQQQLGQSNLLGPQLPQLSQVEKQLPQPESEFFPQFLNAPKSRRQEIGKMLPSAEAYLLRRYWAVKDAAEKNEISSFQESPQQQQMPQQEAQQSIINFQANNASPIEKAHDAYSNQLYSGVKRISNKSALTPNYSSAAMDLVYKQKMSYGTAYYNNGSNISMGFTGGNVVNMRRQYA